MHVLLGCFENRPGWQSVSFHGGQALGSEGTLVLPKSYSPTTPLQPGGTFPKPRELLSGSFGDPENWHKVSFLFFEGLSWMWALNPESGP